MAGMTMEELHTALVAPADRLTALLRSKDVVDFLNKAHDALAKMPALDDATAKIAVLEERLKKAGEREAGLRQQLTEMTGGHEALKRAHGNLQQQVAAMREHPDVRRAERERLAEQMAELQRQHAALADPEPPQDTDGLADATEREARGEIQDRDQATTPTE